MEIQICRSIKKTIRDVWNLLLLAFIDDFIPREPLHLLKQIVKMQTEVRVNYLNCHIHVPSKHVLANREANSRHTFDVTIWLSRTTDNSNIFIRSREVPDNESRLYLLNMVNWISFSSILQIWYVEVWISRSISESPLEFEIMRVDCNFLWKIKKKKKKKNQSVVCCSFDWCFQG